MTAALNAAKVVTCWYVTEQKQESLLEVRKTI